MGMFSQKEQALSEKERQMQEEKMKIQFDIEMQKAQMQGDQKAAEKQVDMYPTYQQE